MTSKDSSFSAGKEINILKRMISSVLFGMQNIPFPSIAVDLCKVLSVSTGSGTHLILCIIPL